jgi:pimeloyl-ACP methyl ester carboxylesterase
MRAQQFPELRTKDEGLQVTQPLHHNYNTSANLLELRCANPVQLDQQHIKIEIQPIQTLLDFFRRRQSKLLFIKHGYNKSKLKKMTTGPSTSNSANVGTSTGANTSINCINNINTTLKHRLDGGTAAAFVPACRTTRTKNDTTNTLYASMAAMDNSKEFPDMKKIAFVVKDINVSSQSSSEQAANTVHEKLKTREDEPNLFNLPSTLSPTYQSIPILTKAWIGIFSTLLSTISHGKSKVKPGSSLFWGKNLLKFIIKMTVTGLFSTVLVQEALFLPSRINTSTLIEREWLPSPLSYFSIVSTEIDPVLLPSKSKTKKDDNYQSAASSIGPIGVHYLRYESDTQNKSNFDAIHFNHGFGASSLSWLPVIPSLTKKLGANVAIAHDAPGFGFTDRPRTYRQKNSLVPYSSAGSAALGNALLLNKIDYCSSEKDVSDDDDKEQVKGTSKDKRVALFGHSMGCAATLRMAISLPRDIQKVVVLVAPALLGSSNNSESPTTVVGTAVAKTTKKQTAIANLHPSEIRSWINIFFATLRQVVIDSPLKIILRRVVAKSDFWLKGLRLAWGNPDLLTESDALRFQWPSIGLGWESGLLAFTRSRIGSICSYDGGEQKLLDDIAKLPNTSIIIVHGTKDPVIPVGMSQQIVERLKSSVSYIELDGQGHDPFEEGIEEFVEKVVQSIPK